MNTGYKTNLELRILMSKLIGREVDEGFGLFPPFFADCPQNIHLGKEVFINSGCKFQAQGGIYIGDKSLIGHNTVIATINHDINPETRRDLFNSKKSKYWKKCLDRFRKYNSSRGVNRR